MPLRGNYVQVSVPAEVMAALRTLPKGSMSDTVNQAALTLKTREALALLNRRERLRRGGAVGQDHNARFPVLWLAPLPEVDAHAKRLLLPRTKLLHAAAIKVADTLRDQPAPTASE